LAAPFPLLAGALDPKGPRRKPRPREPNAARWCVGTAKRSAANARRSEAGGTQQSTRTENLSSLLVCERWAEWTERT
jgi:hypothetical protein